MESGGTRALYPVDAAALEQELQWLQASQTDQGALAQNPQQTDVVPYFANLAAMALVRDNPDLVRRYVEWYLGHLNHPDRFGFYGTIYDYHLRPGGRATTRPNSWRWRRSSPACRTATASSGLNPAWA